MDQGHGSADAGEAMTNNTKATTPEGQTSTGQNQPAEGLPDALLTVDETCAGPNLMCEDFTVRTWLGTEHNMNARIIASQVNLRFAERLSARVAAARSDDALIIRQLQDALKLAVGAREVYVAAVLHEAAGQFADASALHAFMGTDVAAQIRALISAPAQAALDAHDAASRLDTAGREKMLLEFVNDVSNAVVYTSEDSGSVIDHDHKERAQELLEALATRETPKGPALDAVVAQAVRKGKAEVLRDMAARVYLEFDSDNILKDYVSWLNGAAAELEKP